MMQRACLASWQPWNPWQQRFLGVALAWWLCAAPSVTRALWPSAIGGKVPALLASILDLSPAWLLGGVVLALAALSTDFRERTVAQRLARWFLLGVATLPVLLALR